MANFYGTHPDITEAERTGGVPPDCPCGRNDCDCKEKAKQARDYWEGFYEDE